MEENFESEVLEYSKDLWEEKVYIETAEYIIRGIVYIPKIGRRSRVISDLLNTNKNFISVKNASIESKLHPRREVQKCDFISVNIATILIMRPCP